MRPARRCELAGAPHPPPGLHARHRDVKRLFGGHQDWEIDDAILFRSDEFFAVEDQHRHLGEVLHEQLRHTTGL